MRKPARALVLSLTALALGAWSCKESPSRDLILTNLSLSQGQELHLRFEVPEGQGPLGLHMSEGFGDADLYVRYGAPPTTSLWDYRPYEVGNQESVSVESPPAGTWYAMVRAYTGFEDVTLEGLRGDFTLTGLSAIQGSPPIAFAIDVPGGATELSLSMSGGTGDADLYLRQGTPATLANWDYRPFFAGNTEEIVVEDPDPGMWFVLINAYTSFSGVDLELSPGPQLELYSSPGTPTIQHSMTPPAVFVGQSATQDWTVTNATCVNNSSSGYRASLIADSSQTNGWRRGGGSYFAGGWPGCAVPLTGSSSWAQATAGHHVHTITAENSSASVQKSRNLDVMPEPDFQGCSNSDQNKLKIAVQQAMKALRSGCILHDSNRDEWSKNLDKYVAAFRDGHLDREAVWSDLVAILHNLDVFTFECFYDANGSYASTSDYSSKLRFNTKYNWDELTLIHELSHKVGINGTISGSYQGWQIEDHARRLSYACVAPGVPFDKPTY
jgi:hypothetical protein